MLSWLQSESSITIGLPTQSPTSYSGDSPADVNGLVTAGTPCLVPSQCELMPWLHSSNNNRGRSCRLPILPTLSRMGRPEQRRLLVKLRVRPSHRRVSPKTKRRPKHLTPRNQKLLRSAQREKTERVVRQRRFFAL